MTLAIVNLDGDLADPQLLGLLHANDPALEVEIEIFDEDAWFEQEPVEDELPARWSLRAALRALFKR